MPVITVRHALGSYPVYVEPGILGRLGPLIATHLPDRRLALVTDSTVQSLFREFRRSRTHPWVPEAGDPAQLPSFAAELVVPPGKRRRRATNGPT